MGIYIIFTHSFNKYFWPGDYSLLGAAMLEDGQRRQASLHSRAGSTVPTANAAKAITREMCNDSHKERRTGTVRVKNRGHWSSCHGAIRDHSQWKRHWTTSGQQVFTN